MVRPNRIKTFDWNEIGGSLVANANGILDVYSHRPINGAIQKIVKFQTNFTQTGSLMFFVSGTNESIFNWRSGTAQGTVGSIVNTLYLFTYTTNNNASTGSPQAYSQIVLNDNIRIIGSGLGNGTSGLNIQIVYI